MAVAAASAVALAGCSSASPARPLTASQKLTLRAEGRGPVLRLGLVDGLVGAPGLVAVQKGYFQQDLGAEVILKPMPYATAAAEAKALAAGQLDAAYLDPVAAVRLWQDSRGRLIRVVAGAATGGAELVVSTKVTGPGKLAGKAVAAPAGSAQDAALGLWLRQHAITASAATGRASADGAAAVQAFRAGQVAGGWELAPFDAQMAADGGHVLVNEASLWPGSRFATAVLVVTVKFLSAHPAMVTALLKGQVEGSDLLNTDRTAAQAAAGTELTDLFGHSLPAQLLTASFAQITFTNDPLAGTMLAEAQHAAAAGLLKPPESLAGLFDLGPLNKLLRAVGQATVPG
jgi:NitT/TauT family transport system substrate-binding protein